MGTRGTAPKSKPQPASYRAGVPPPPAWLDQAAVAEYKRAAREIESSEHALQTVDLSALATYAQAYSDFARLTLEIREEGEVRELPNGIRTENPKLKTRARVQRALLQAVGQLGFSPMARARIPRSVVAAKAESAFAAYIR